MLSRVFYTVLYLAYYLVPGIRYDLYRLYEPRPAAVLLTVYTNLSRAVYQVINLFPVPSYQYSSMIPGYRTYLV